LTTETKVEFVKQIFDYQKPQQSLWIFTIPEFLKLPVHRNKILEDPFQIFRNLENQKKEFKKRLHVTFIGETGIGAGGLQTKYFRLFLQQIFRQSSTCF
jgi:hypothetical protein